MHTEIKRWGNSAAIRLSSKILAQAKLEISSPISIDVQEGKIVITAIEKTARKIKFPFSEADLLQGLDAHSAHAVEIAELSTDELGA